MTAGFQKLFRSPHPLALEHSLIDQIETYKKKSPMGRAFVLVPNHYVAAHLQHEFALKRAHLNIIFETIEGFSARLLSTHPEFLKKKRFTPETEIFWIGRITQQQLKNTELETISNKNGFHKNLRSFFHHLISNQTLKIPKVNMKTGWFDTLFSKYLTLKDKYHHGLWNVELASKSDLKIEAPVFIYGFTQFTKLQQSFFNQIAKHSHVQLWMEVFSSDKFQESTFMWLDEVFQDIEDLAVGDSPRIGTVRVLQPCHHFEDEAQWIAQTIIGDCTRKSCFDGDTAGSLMGQSTHEKRCVSPDKTAETVTIKSLHRIGIFLNDYDAQEPTLRKKLVQYGIPNVPIRGRKLKETRFGMSFETLINLLLTHWNRAEWFDFLQSFPFKASIYEKNGTATEWNHISVEAGISNRDSFFIERLVHYATEHKAKKIFSFIEFQKQILNDVTHIENEIRMGMSNFVNLLNRFFQDYADPKEITPTVLLFFDELNYICSEMKQTPSRNVQNLILEKLESTYFTEKKFESDGVLIAPISMMKSLFFDVIFLPQFNEGKFPKNVEKPFDLHPDEIKMIASKSPIRFAQTSDQFDEQYSWFDSAKDHCTQSLYISYSAYGLPKEEDLKPSLFLHGLEKESIFIPQNIFEEPVAPDLQQQVQKWIENSQSNTWNEYNSFLDTKYIFKSTYSSSDLSKYATCPKKYFLGSVLGLSTKDYLETQFQMMPKDKGNLVHEILFKFFTQLKQKKLIPLKKENRTEMQMLLSTIANEICKHQRIFGSYGISNLWNIDEGELLANLMEYLDREIAEGSYWIPYSFEHRFGMPKHKNQEDDEHSSEEPLPLQLLQKKLMFKGRVDRIDVSADKTRLRITDYKTGQLEDRKSWGYEKGEQLQIPLYVLLADQFFSNKNLQEVNGKLVSIQAISKFDERNVTRTEILAKQDEIFSHLEMIDQGINSGNFFPNPGDNGKNCSYCDYKKICGSNIHQVVEEMDETPFMTTFQESKKALP